MRTFGWPYPFAGRPWEELRDDYRSLADRSPEFDHLVAIVDSVLGSCVREALAGATSMHDLLVTDDADQDPPVELLVIRAPGSLHAASAGLVRIEHLTHSGRGDRIDRPTAEAVPLFWRFVREKFGLTSAVPP